MGLSTWLARYAVRSSRVLIVESPGSWLTRAAVEQQVARRGWRLALSPAEADVLAVCGSPGPKLTEAVARVWDQLPGPRAQVRVADAGGAAEALERAERSLLDVAQQIADSRLRAPAPEAENAAEDAPAMDHGAHGGMDMAPGGGMDHGAHGGMDMAPGGGMDHGAHGGMDMAPGGIALAEGSQDRDGLEMDRLHLRLGPVLPYWPAGLVLRCSLQGDVVVEASAEVLDAELQSGRSDDPIRSDRPAASLRAARRCDDVVSLLALAGWDDTAASARRVRDALLSPPSASAETAVDVLRRTVERSRLLRWSLRGVGRISDAHIARHGCPGWWRGDTYDRLLFLLRQVSADLSANPSGSVSTDGPVGDPATLPQLVTGLELANARLLVASLDLQPSLAARTMRHA